MTWLCDLSTECQTFVTWHDCVTCVLNIRYLWHDMTPGHMYWISEFVTWHITSLWHEYWISVICVMTWICDMYTEYQTFFDMTWLCDICTKYKILLWTDMNFFHAYWISDICDMKWYDLVLWILNMRYLCYDMIWLVALMNEYLILVTCYVFVTCVLNIRHFLSWHDMVFWLKYWISDICEWHDYVIWLLNIRLLWHDISMWHVYWKLHFCVLICHDCLTCVL